MNERANYFETEPIDADWFEQMRKNGWTFDSIYPVEVMERLKRTLLRYGGGAVVLSRIDPDVDRILNRGMILDGSMARKGIGRSNECHGNAARNFRRFGYGIMCGYGLSEDGAWRMHSWNLRKDTIIETTVRWVAYYGFELNESECEQFALENC